MLRLTSCAPEVFEIAGQCRYGARELGAVDRWLFGAEVDQSGDAFTRERTGDGLAVRLDRAVRDEADLEVGCLAGGR